MYNAVSKYVVVAAMAIVQLFPGLYNWTKQKDCH